MPTASKRSFYNVSRFINGWRLNESRTIGVFIWNNVWVNWIGHGRDCVLEIDGWVMRYLIFIPLILLTACDGEIKNVDGHIYLWKRSAWSANWKHDPNCPACRIKEE